MRAKLGAMDAKTASLKVAKAVRAGIAAMLLPVFFLYILLDKPDYKIMNAMSGVVVPAARLVGNGITWPVRALGTLGRNISERANVRRENAELRMKLDALIAAQTECMALLGENQRLEQALDMVRLLPKKSVMARIVFENSAFSSHTFILDKGENSAVATGQAVISKNGYLAGVVTQTGVEYAHVRGVTDVGANTPVRVAGSDVLGFLRGRGNADPVFEMFSDQEFSPTNGIMLLTSSVGGNLPDGIPIGRIKDASSGKSATVEAGAKTMSDAVVLIYK